MQRTELVAYLNDYLNIANFNDYAPNGLQIEGRDTIKTIVTGVTACQALIDAAIALQADAVLVHHGYFWKNEPAQIVGIKQKRVKALLAHDINLLAYHLPLDQHAVLGNNVLLGQLWGLQDITPGLVGLDSLVRLGRLPKACSIDAFATLVSNSLQRPVLHLSGGKNTVQTVAWCSGGAQNYIDQAIAWQADVYISGEVSEQTTHLAKEGGVHYFAAGHHATERLGIKALGEHLADKFGLQCHFVDIANPV
ncbi:Nif3-like dinuclear metal center hexameric protein [Thiomicrorhabdus aquaedulcis]|uniref:Nif3-like dinuclear metal center hexameric protein n=1 Tax=Thiomicrorhabdus aquaedulcis TaxID=2211106 RepID=UPI000FD73DD7|nr:Nif3-like dinuclear metal center hexameric protein [Thiomicrorhabdus aquaedulcis]